MFKIVFPAVCATMVAADLPVIEVSLAGSAFSAMEKTRENMENSFIAQLKNKVSMIQQRSSAEKAKAISNVLDLHSALFQTEKDNAVTHAALMQAPTSLRVRVSGGEAALVEEVAKHEAKLNAREEDMFRADKLREIRDVVSGVVASLAEAKHSSFMEVPSFPEYSFFLV